MGLMKYLYFLAAIGISGSASAAGIAHWVDADGVAHYGNPQFAPAGESNLERIHGLKEGSLLPGSNRNLRISASAAGIAHWVDADGVAHYGNPQFAPAGESNLIEVAAANIMDVPVAPSAKSRLPRFVIIRHQHKLNKRTWQGSRPRNLRRKNRSQRR